MITSVFKIQDTVIEVSYKAKSLIPEIPIVKRESRLLYELVLCILSSQEKYEVALAVIRLLKKGNSLRVPKNKTEFKEIKHKIKNSLKEPVYFKFNNKIYHRRMRFFAKKAHYVTTTIQNIYLNDLSLRKILNSKDRMEDVRKIIINYCCGLGPKQASMFLRNVGYYSELAVLDKHVIDYMKMLGVTSSNTAAVSNISSYQKVETELKKYAETFEIDLLHLDLAIWTTMRVLKYYKG